MIEVLNLYFTSSFYLKLRNGTGKLQKVILMLDSLNFNQNSIPHCPLKVVTNLLELVRCIEDFPDDEFIRFKFLYVLPVIGVFEIMDDRGPPQGFR
jgi:hypothetical protein